MSRARAVKVEHIGDFPLDKPGMFLRAERRHWPDGSSCLHVAKWGQPPERRAPIPWWPPQYTQIAWPLAPGFLKGLLEAVGRGGATPMPSITWQAYCLTCKASLYASPKGRDVDKVARQHVLVSGHTVLLGYEMHPDMLRGTVEYENEPCDLGLKEARPTLFDREETPHA